MDEYLTLNDELLGKVRHVKRQAFAWGNTRLLDETAVGICGSRKASDHGLSYSYDLGHLAAEFGLVVISGYAAGVDQQAHRGAIDGGGSTIAVLSEGIERFRLRKELREVVTGENFLAFSEFPPEASWTSWRAMSRNLTIIRLANAMFVVEAGETGGTLEAGKTTLAEGKPLFVLEFMTEREQTRGNRILLELGATPIPNLKSLKNALELAKTGQLVGAGRLL